MKKFKENQKGMSSIVMVICMLPILAIGTGIYIYNSAKDSVVNSDLDSYYTDDYSDYSDYSNDSLYSDSYDVIEDASSSMSEQEVSLFNGSFESYLGDSKKGIDAKSVIDIIISSNNNYVGTSGRFVALTTSNFVNTNAEGVNSTIGTPGDTNNDAANVSTQSSAMSAVKTVVNTGKTYNIKANYGSDGYINEIVITEN